jgi:hypothetical protein
VLGVELRGREQQANCGSRGTSCGLQDRVFWYFEDGEDHGVVYFVLHLEELVVEGGEMDEFGKGKKKTGAILKEKLAMREE